MRKDNVSTFVAALFGLLIALPAVGPVRAGGIPVIDGANLAQTVIQVMNDVRMLANQASQIANQVEQMKKQSQMLQNIGASQYMPLTNALNNQSVEINGILATASGIKYSLAQVQAEIDATFPQGADWDAFDMATLTQRLQQWDNVVSEANSLAMRAQTSLGRVSGRNDQLQRLMVESRGAEGQVRQLQINAQLNGQIAQALNDTLAVSATAARSQMLALQREVAARELARERHRRMMVGFTDRGAPVAVLNRLPPIAPHP